MKGVASIWLSDYSCALLCRQICLVICLKCHSVRAPSTFQLTRTGRHSKIFSEEGASLDPIASMEALGSTAEPPCCKGLQNT
ncbi:hypothetical protein CEXT_147971 [Caerostris extrusa]|uniref:Secreted protein n=1 Tax=Caerostris extrusa TaxID=172846 RepID=A0AAV4RYN6_CAEEX|nr:hypothetical protein CEXT_147971 [Caerostris extrusa]